MSDIQEEQASVLPTAKIPRPIESIIPLPLSLVSSSTRPAPLTFLALPVEIRISIHEYVFADSTIFIWSALRFRGAKIYWRHSPDQTQVLLTNKQFYSEALPTLYGTATWDISSAAASGFGSDPRSIAATPHIEKIKVVSGMAIDFLALPAFVGNIFLAKCSHTLTRLEIIAVGGTDE